MPNKKAVTCGWSNCRSKQTIGIVSGTDQFYFELYTPGTEKSLPWYDKMPPNLLDPTGIMTRVFGIKRNGHFPLSSYSIFTGEFMKDI
jgi:hypothetical protein